MAENKRKCNFQCPQIITILATKGIFDPFYPQYLLPMMYYLSYGVYDGDHSQVLFTKTIFKCTKCLEQLSYKYFIDRFASNVIVSYINQLNHN